MEQTEKRKTKDILRLKIVCIKITFSHHIKLAMKQFLQILPLSDHFNYLLGKDISKIYF